MKRIILYSVTILSVMIITACSSQKNLLTENHWSSGNSNDYISMLTKYVTFEEALLLSTDIVVAQYVGYRSFGDNSIEFEFVVLERVLGESADRIFVYAINSTSTTIGAIESISYKDSDLSFYAGGQYLLVLERIWLPHSKVNENGYMLVRNLVVDLDNPQNSAMYGEPLHLHSELNFSRGCLSREQIVDYAREIAKNNHTDMDHIKSLDVTEVVEGSDYILLVEINELHSMARTDFQHTDVFFCTVIQVIKGDLEPGFELGMIFLADTVQPGEQHIIMVRRIEEGSSLFEFTSRNSMFETTQFGEIMAIAKHQQ